MSDVIFPTEIPNGTPAADDRILLSDTSNSGAAFDAALSDLPVSTPTQTALNDKESTSNKGAANGYAPLDASGKIPTANLPAGMGTGDVVGPASATDNAISRFDGTTGKLVQSSSVSITDGGDLSGVNGVNFSTSPSVLPNAEGTAVWNPTDKCLDLYDGETKLQVGQEVHVVAHNDSGSIIGNGKAVYISGAFGTRPTIALAKADDPLTSDRILGISTQSIADLSEGKVTISGLVNNIDTSAISAGSAIYLSATTAGSFTSVEPEAPNYSIHIGHVIVSNAVTGSILSDPYVVTQLADSVKIPAGTGVQEVNNVQDFFRHSWSTGITEGCDVTDNLDGTVSISAGEGLFRSSDVDDAELKAFVIPAATNVSLTANDVSYLYVNYNAGNPVWAVGTSLADFNGLTKVVGYVIGRKSNTLNVLDIRKINVDGNRKNSRQKVEFDGVVFNGFYRSRLGVSALSASGLSIVTGVGNYFFWDNLFSHSAFNTVTAGTALQNVFTNFYNRVGTWTLQEAQKTLNNTQYDSGGTLTAFGGGTRYRTDWCFVAMDGPSPYLFTIMGDAQYATLSDAQNAPFPTSLPPQVDGISVFLGRLIVQKSSTTVTVSSAGGFTFSGGAGASDHTALTNLAWTASGHTGTASSFAAFDGAGTATHIATNTIATLSGATFTGDVIVPDEAYDATAWNGNMEVPTKNAVRDKIESMGTGGSSLWTAVTGTRTGNTTFTVTGDQTATFSRGLVIKWTESSVVKCAHVESSVFSTVTTVTIVGDAMASIDASSLKYTSQRIVKIKAAAAGAIGTVVADTMNVFYADEPYRILSCGLAAGTAGVTGSTTVDVNKNGTTMFTTKPSLASGVASSPVPFTADSGSSLAIGDRVSFDVDGVQTTPAFDLYVTVNAFPVLGLNLA